MTPTAVKRRRSSRAPPGRDADPLDPVTIGARVKALRESESLSLRELALRSGVSAPMLSQVERGETSPTLTVAARIAAGLELRLSQLLRLDEDGAVTIVRAGERSRGGNKRRGHSFEVMTAAQPGQRAELSRHALAPGGATGAADDPPMHEPGSRETALVEHGVRRARMRRQRYELKRGRLRHVRRRPSSPLSRTPAGAEAAFPGGRLAPG